jgi:hypothetical protein
MDFLNPYATIDIEIIDLIRNMGLGLLLALAWTFIISRTTRLIVDTRQYLPVFLLLIPSMILIISIIKSSIALSLGLVGALSIVRFRTPIKEPEELLYLFVAIAVGLGLGANQIIATLVGFGAICIGMLALSVVNISPNKTKSVFVDLNFPKSPTDLDVSAVETALTKLKYKFKIKRVHQADGQTEILLDMANFDMKEFTNLKNGLLDISKDVRVSATENARIIT